MIPEIVRLFIFMNDYDQIMVPSISLPHSPFFLSFSLEREGIKLILRSHFDAYDIAVYVTCILASVLLVYYSVSVDITLIQRVACIIKICLAH